MNQAVNQCNFDRITRSLRRGTSKRDLQDVALSSLGFTTLIELEDDMAMAVECGTTVLRREEFRQKRAHMARAAACMEAVFSLPDLEPLMGPLDKIARDAVLTSLRRCQPLILAHLPVDSSTIPVPEGLTPDIVQMIYASQHKAGNPDFWVAHQVLFEHRHAEPSPSFHAEIVETFHSSDPGWVYLCFRNSGKSTLSEEGFILRALLRLFGNALVLGFNQQRAVERLEAIKHEMEANERLAAIFGDMRGQVWQGQKITLTNGVCLQAVASGQSLRGIKHYNFRPDCLLLDDVEGDVGASTPLEREATKKWFFGTVLPALASKSIIRMAATPLDMECLPVTLGKMATWKTMVVPVRSMAGNEDAFFESWLADQGIEVPGVEHLDAGHVLDGEPSTLRDEIKQLVAAQNRPVASSTIDELPHVAEEHRPAKNFDLVHEAEWPSAPKRSPEAQAPGPRKPEAPRRKRAGQQPIPDAKSTTPAPTPVPEPEAQRELTEVERAFNFKFPR
jgi:hypothetical protein